MRTARKAQQALFLENLWREMDKLSSTKPGDNMSRMAAKYAADGYDDGEIVELLVADGFDPHFAKSCVAKMDVGGEDDGGEGREWGFEAEDQRRGDVVSNHDVRCASVTAPNESMAWEKAQSFLDDNCSDIYSVTRVYLL